MDFKESSAKYYSQNQDQKNNSSQFSTKSTINEETQNSVQNSTFYLEPLNLNQPQSKKKNNIDKQNDNISLTNYYQQQSISDQPLYIQPKYFLQNYNQAEKRNQKSQNFLDLQQYKYTENFSSKSNEEQNKQKEYIKYENQIGQLLDTKMQLNNQNNLKQGFKSQEQKQQPQKQMQTQFQEQKSKLQRNIFANIKIEELILSNDIEEMEKRIEKWLNQRQIYIVEVTKEENYYQQKKNELFEIDSLKNLNVNTQNQLQLNTNAVNNNKYKNKSDQKNQGFYLQFDQYQDKNTRRNRSINDINDSNNFEYDYEVSFNFKKLESLNNKLDDYGNSFIQIDDQQQTQKRRAIKKSINHYNYNFEIEFEKEESLIEKLQVQEINQSQDKNEKWNKNSKLNQQEKLGKLFQKEDNQQLETYFGVRNGKYKKRNIMQIKRSQSEQNQNDKNFDIEILVNDQNQLPQEILTQNSDNGTQNKIIKLNYF
ncbi:hypothetical protein PPERSA_03069 [Pseudocohnilembus persalinus]|uniref:Uncharacterized protein n=1 Tax=Pseudocohnilembus persalinus TaxID=266149 RepID=A0A0V0QL68_PSEPJ|nr:hypothetical protein PPERSA_03069 [Pseudocohnilembus persalinus]|eukprot:KRX02978.1 hypothetical protein PPERSA_03069 [Pseudocohnilembus persalinus]